MRCKGKAIFDIRKLWGNKVLRAEAKPCTALPSRTAQKSPARQPSGTRGGCLVKAKGPLAAHDGSIVLEVLVGELKEAVSRVLVIGIRGRASLLEQCHHAIDIKVIGHCPVGPERTQYASEIYLIGGL